MPLAGWQRRRLSASPAWLGAGVRWELLSVMSFVHVSLLGGVPLVDPLGTPHPQHGVLLERKGRRGWPWHLFAESGGLPLGYFSPLFPADSLSVSNSFKH